MRIPVTVIFLVFLFACCTQEADAQEMEYYSSVAALTKLVSSETILLGFLKEVIKGKYFINVLIERYIKDVAKITSNNKENPVEAFKLVYRSYHDLGQLEEQMLRTDHSEAYKKNITELDIHVKESELMGATMALDRLQSAYQLPTEDLARGILLNYKSPEMSGVDSFEIGRYLHDSGYLKRSLEWLTQARLPQHIDHEDMNEFSLISYLASSYFYMGNYKMAMQMCHEMLEIDPTYGYALEMLEDAKQKLETFRPLKKQQILSPEVPKSTVEDMYEKVCRGELTQTPREKKDLRCRYTSNNVPFCILAPFKVEEMSLDPYIRVFYDAIYDNEVTFIKNETQDRMARSQVATEEGNRILDTCISHQAWLKLEEIEPLANMAARLDDITGLTRDSAEDLQVLNYGIGGHYGTHHDFMEDYLLREHIEGYLGDRIMTALFYISDVELGGGTGFPLLRLLVPPKKGSLVVWYNQHESLALDYRTLHGGCPVLRGVKYISTLWYHSTYQEFRRPCLLYPNGNFSIANYEY